MGKNISASGEGRGEPRPREWPRRSSTRSGGLGHGAVRTGPAGAPAPGLSAGSSSGSSPSSASRGPLAEPRSKRKRARETFDCRLTPIVKRAAQGGRVPRPLATVTAALRPSGRSCPGLPARGAPGPCSSRSRRSGSCDPEPDRIRDGIQDRRVGGGPVGGAQSLGSRPRSHAHARHLRRRCRRGHARQGRGTTSHACPGPVAAGLHLGTRGPFTRGAGPVGPAARAHWRVRERSQREHDFSDGTPG